MAYAENTTVPVERSRAEIEGILRRYGADSFISGWDAERAFVAFRAAGRHVKFVLPLPKKGEERFTHRPPRSQWGTPTKRTPEDSLKQWEQACRSSWRSLLLAIKAKLESVDAKIETFEQAFLAHIVLPDGVLVGDWIMAGLQAAYETGRMPALPAHSEEP